jgi:hypothetical protein
VQTGSPRLAASQPRSTGARLVGRRPSKVLSFRASPTSSTLEQLVGVEEVAGATGSTVAMRFGYAHVDSYGTVTPAGSAPYLDCVAAPDNPATTAASQLPWLAVAEDKARSWRRLIGRVRRPPDRTGRPQGVGPPERVYLRTGGHQSMVPGGGAAAPPRVPPTTGGAALGAHPPGVLRQGGTDVAVAPLGKWGHQRLLHLGKARRGRLRQPAEAAGARPPTSACWCYDHSRGCRSAR